MNLQTLRYYSNNLTIIFLFLAIVVASLVSAANYFYFKSVIYDKQASQVTGAFTEQTDFATAAKELLNTNKDVVYAKLVDSDGILQQSFGSSDSLGTKEIIVKNSDGTEIFVGVNRSALSFPVELPVAATVVISLLVLGLFLIALKLYYPFQKNSLNRLNEQLIRISEGDYSAKLEIDSDLKDDVDMIKVFDSFNEMADSLKLSVGYREINSTSDLADIETNGNGDVQKNVTPDKDFSELNHSMQENLESHTEVEIESYKDPVINDPVIEDSANDLEKTGNGSQIKIIKDSNTKNVVALVSKISDYKKLTQTYDSSELALLLTDYRKTASSIITQYGGMVETLVRDELVALFNVSDNQDKPELRAVSAGVELLQTLVEINKHKIRDDDEQICCRIGVYSSSIPVSKESGTPSNLSLAIEPAKEICEKSSDWKLMLSPGVYSSVKEFVEVSPPKNGLHKNYSVLAVEEGVINI